MQRFPYYSGPTFSYQRLDFVPTGGCISGESFISSTFPILDREFINFKMFFFFQCLRLAFSFYWEIMNLVWKKNPQANLLGSWLCDIFSISLFCTFVVDFQFCTSLPYNCRWKQDQKRAYEIEIAYLLRMAKNV